MGEQGGLGEVRKRSQIQAALPEESYQASDPSPASCSPRGDPPLSNADFLISADAPRRCHRGCPLLCLHFLQNNGLQIVNVAKMQISGRKSYLPYVSVTHYPTLSSLQKLPDSPSISIPHPRDPRLTPN